MSPKKSLFTAILVVLFGIWGSALALEGEYKTPTPEDNQKLLASGVQHTEAALAAAKAGDGKAADEHAKAAVKELVEINSEAWGPTIEGATSKIRVGGTKAKKGDHEAGAEMIEKGLTALKKL